MKIFNLKIKSILWSLIILFLSLIKISPPDKIKVLLFPNSDKLVHIIIYAIFMGLILWEYKKNNKYILMMVVILYGILMEYLQYALTDYRSFEIRDIIADTLGAIFMLLTFNYFNKKIKL